MNEPLLTVAEVAIMLDVSNDTVRRMFAPEPGVIDLGPKQGHGDRKYRILRIPRRVLDRVIAERAVGAVGAADARNSPSSNSLGDED